MSLAKNSNTIGKQLDDSLNSLTNFMHSMESVPDSILEISDSIVKISDSIEEMQYAPGDIRSYGAVSDDITKGEVNNIAILNAISSGHEVIIEGTYTVTPTENNAVIGGLSMRGQGLAKIIFDGKAYPWITLGNAELVSLKGISFVNNSAGAVTFFDTINNVLIDSFQVNSGCTFDNDIRLFHGRFSEKTDPSESLYGIKHVDISNNIINNIGNVFFNAPDMPFRSFRITNNTISEMGRICFNLGISNDHAYYSEIRDSKEHIHVEGNSVINKNVRETTKGMYLCFVLFEGDRFTYQDNYVEGLCTLENKEVYDIYTNGSRLKYHCNTWKNIMCFNSDKAGADLMKGKGARSRVYDGNKFILEKSFVDKHGGAVDTAWVNLVSQTNPGHLVVRNNDIDVFALRSPGGIWWLSLIVENNDIKSRYAEKSLFEFSNRPGEISDYRNLDLRIVRNRVRIREVKNFSFSRFDRKDDSGQGTYKSLIISGNDIRIDKATGVVRFAYSASDFEVDMMKLTDNLWEVRESTIGRDDFTRYSFGRVGVFLESNNVIIKPDGTTTHYLTGDN